MNEAGVSKFNYPIANDLESIETYIAIIDNFRFARRSIWSLHETEKTGWLDYELLINKTREEVLSIDSRLLLSNMSSAPQVMCARILEPALNTRLQEIYAQADKSAAGDVTASRRSDAGQQVKVGRNSPCPCGSGKKCRRCHGA